MMTAESSVDSREGVGVGPFDRPALELARWSVGTLIGLLWCAAALVGWRRLAGALPLDPPRLLLVGALVAVLAVGVRSSWHRLARGYPPSRLQWAGALLTSAAILLLGAAVSLRGTNAGGLIAFWALLVGEELWAWRPAVWRRLRRRPKAPSTARPQQVDSPQVSSPRPAPPVPVDDVPADDVLQQLTRSRAADGSEQLAGWLRTPFAAGQRTANVHVAFCPPFPKTPQLSVEQLDGPPARIKTAQLLAHGARLDLKLAALAEKPDTVLLQFAARSKGET